MRAISVKVNEVIGVAGFVVPGTRVDVLVTVRGSNAPRTADTRRGQQRPGAHRRYATRPGARDEGGKPMPTRVVTLLLTPEDAETMTLASEEGKVMLALRNPLDRRRPRRTARA